MSDLKLTELSKSLSSTMSVSEERSGRLADALGVCIKAALSASKGVSIPKFGSFSLAGKGGKPVPVGAKANLMGDLSKKVGESDSRVEGMVNALFDAVKKELLAGKRIVLDDLGVFEVKIQPPKIERQTTGHRLISPAGSAVGFESLHKIKGAAVLFSAAPELTGSMEAMKESSIMLVVPERDFFTKTLEYYFEKAGWDLEVYTQMIDALKKIETGKAYLVILDAGMKDYQKFCYALKMRRETTNVPLILMHPGGKTFASPPQVSIVGDENIPQPFEFRQLLDTADAEIIRTSEAELKFLQQLAIHVPTDEQSIEKVIDTVHKLLEGSGINEEGQVATSAAFREAVVNAAQHGNKYKRDRRIEIQYLLDAEKITAVVLDQGAGFNHQQFVSSGNTRDAISAARERHAQGRMGGLGIMLMLRCCDRLEYNQKGNQITLVKFLTAQE